MPTLPAAHWGHAAAQPVQASWQRSVEDLSSLGFPGSRPGGHAVLQVGHWLHGEEAPQELLRPQAKKAFEPSVGVN